MLELVHRYYEENNLADREIAVSVYYLDYEGNSRNQRLYRTLNGEIS
ncbi:Co-activator of prophage expression IbrA [Lactococcus lactis subsp. lactis]|nr:hypothetical protein LLCRE1631_02014 [Lactococcus lactis subsp. lactis CNCM I-1631]KSU26700.1 Co-activator of prophage expression IbrA [Lactococcus lactis subsp. lactis]